MFSLLLQSSLFVLLGLSSCDREAAKGLPIWKDGTELIASRQPLRVFITPDMHDAVLLREDSPADRLIPVKVSLNNGVIPSFRVSVSRSATTYHYEYSVTNDASAVDGIIEVEVIAPPWFPSASVTFRAEPSTGAIWGGVASSAVLDGASEMGEHVPGRVVYWLPRGSVEDVDSGKLNIMPGQTKGFFIISSPMLPGFTTGKTAGLPYEPPEEALYDTEVEKQLAPLENYFDVTTLTLGPMFLPTAPPQEILANYRTGVARLNQCNGIPHTRVFLDELLGILGEDVITSKMGDRLNQMKTKPSSPIEAELLSCLRLIGDSFANSRGK